MDKGSSSFSPGLPSEIIKFQVKRNIINLYKNFLIKLEDIEDGQPFNYERERKRILDLGNDSIREIESQIDLFEISYKR